MDYPKITIITPSFNQGQFLEETIRSVVEQDYPNLEYFIIDGGSTDNSVEIIKKYESKINYWVSEKDKGQTEAINKGLQRATGEIINWINSDDMLAKGALNHIAEKFKSTGALCLCGPITMFKNEKRWEHPAAYKSGDSLQSVFGTDGYNQPGTFFHRDAILKMGVPDSSLRYVMDKEWWIRFLLSCGIEKIVTTETSLALYRYHDAAKTVAEGTPFLDEYATLVYRVVEAAGEKELLPFISEKFNCTDHPYRFPENFSKPSSVLAQQLAAMLLLRRFYKVYNEKEFDYARRLYAAFQWEKLELTADLQEYLAILKKNASYSSWFFFRLSRKLGFAGKY